MTILADPRLRQAVGLHQSGRLAEAESLYRAILSAHPGSAEVHVNCALAQLGMNKHAAAEASLRQAIAANPRLAKAHFHLGGICCLTGRYADAVQAYEQAIASAPDYAEAHNNLGNALLYLGDLRKAEQAYRKTVTLKPQFAPGYNNLGQVYLQSGRYEEARAAAQRATALRPDYAEAHNNLGNALHALGLNAEAQAAFNAAIRISPNYSAAYTNLAASLLADGNFSAAEIAARRAINLTPGAPEGHDALGSALREQGKLAEAEASYREALRLDPDYTAAYNHLGLILEEYGRLDDAFALFRQHAELSYGPKAKRPGPPEPDPPHKQRHDDEQRAWLGPDAGGFHIAECERLAGPAVNPHNGTQEIEKTWRNGNPQIVVIDDLLTQEALEKLRSFCLRSTVWRKAYDEGYLGAVPEYGFAAPLIAQIAEELRATYPAIFGGHPLLHFWAFKYDSGLRGIKVHADFAAINVNFWITPDEANLDPDHGGLVIWDVAAPLDWNFVKYNSANDEIREFLRSNNAKSVTVPYRANRAVIFDSDLFHETDKISFRPGYENRRINITLLYGRRRDGAKTG
jgi:tetratricopeptide (TPR) repeat protein